MRSRRKERTPHKTGRRRRGGAPSSIPQDWCARGAFVGFRSTEASRLVICAHFLTSWRIPTPSCLPKPLGAISLMRANIWTAWIAVSLAVGCSGAPPEGTPFDAGRGDSYRRDASGSLPDAGRNEEAGRNEDDASGQGGGESDVATGQFDATDARDAGGDALTSDAPGDGSMDAPSDGGPAVQYQLNVVLSGRGHGSVTASPGGIACGSTCSALYAAGTPVVLSASPDSGSVFAGWAGDCTGRGPCNLTMSASHSVTARFFRPVLLSEVDKSADVILTRDRLGMQQLTLGRAGVRSDIAIQPGSGLFYFEGRRLVQARFILIGVATASVPLDSEALSATQGFSID